MKSPKSALQDRRLVSHWITFYGILAFVMRMLVEIVLQGLVTVRNGRILIETVQAMKQCFFERDVSATESLYVIQATGFQSVFERCKIFRFFPNPHMPQEEQLNRETVGFTCFHQMFFIEQPSDKLRGKLTIIFPGNTCVLPYYRLQTVRCPVPSACILPSKMHVLLYL